MAIFCNSHASNRAYRPPPHSSVNSNQTGPSPSNFISPSHICFHLYHTPSRASTSTSHELQFPPRICPNFKHELAHGGKTKKFNHFHCFCFTFITLFPKQISNRQLPPFFFGCPFFLFAMPLLEILVDELLVYREN